uniref:VOC family protein n=1 Tax=Eiseniibacteriota bacterium TaxID=2212470 RepID=A0A832MK72_UNCEI
MPHVERHAHGAFCWPELATPDLAGAGAFYGALLGWTAHAGAASGGTYVTFRLGGRDVGAAQAMNPGRLAGGVPPHWLPFVAVDDCDAAAARVAAHGGTVLGAPWDLRDSGRLAIALDAVGAPFGLWQARRHPGAGVLGDPGAMAWCQLNSGDPATAAAFYGAVFGWGARRDPMPGGGEYTTLTRGAEPAAGIMPMPPGLNAPSHWLVYFAVADVNAAAAQVAALGGATHVPPTDIPGMGRFSVHADPQGATFALVRFAG